MVGSLDNRRVQLFLEAARGLGVAARGVAWTDVERDVGVLDAVVNGPTILRLESTGENEALAVRLRLRGWKRARELGCERSDRVAAPGELLAPRQTHEGFLGVLDTLETWAADRPDVQLQQPVATIRRCFDKARCQRELALAGVPVPEPLEVTDLDHLLELAEQQAVWVKLTCGSSASGLGVLHDRGRVFMTTIRTTDAGRFNAFRVQRLTGDSLRDTLTYLLGEGVHVEANVRRPRLDGARFDLRVLVVEGEPRFCIVRQARHPITNLHLGGWRGSVQALMNKLGDEGRAGLLDLCREVGSLLPAGHLGVDVAVCPDFRSFAVLEVNAFGDLLPRLTMDGLDSYGVEIVSRLPNDGGRVLHCP